QAYVDDQLFCEQDRPEAHLYARVARVPINFVDDLATLVTNGCAKVVCVSEDPEVINACERALVAGLGDGARVTRSVAAFVEVVSPRVNKAVAVEVLCARLGAALRE